METEEEIRRRTRIEAHERYQIGKRTARRLLRIAGWTIVVVIVVTFAFVLIAPHVLGWI
jgi:hypothetical protein